MADNEKSETTNGYERRRKAFRMVVETMSVGDRALLAMACCEANAYAMRDNAQGSEWRRALDAAGRADETVPLPLLDQKDAKR